MSDPGRRLRICQIMECTIGGTRRHIVELSVGLARAGHDVTLIASARRDASFRDDLRRIAASGVRVIELPMRRELGAVDAWHLLRIASHLLRRRYDIIHSHSSKAGVLGRVAALITLSRARRVHTPHTFAFNFSAQFGARRRRLFLAIERRLGRHTHAMVHVGRSEREEGLAFGIIAAERAVVIENGIDPVPYRDVDGGALRRELGIAADVPLIGSVGLLNEAKGYPDLIAAAQIVHASLPEAVFVIVGEGGLRGDLERRIEHTGQRDTVRLLGYRTDVPHVLAALDLFCLPSLWEGLPYVILEAMASRKAVVATDVNGCRDLVADGVTGVLVPKASPAALAGAITELLQDAPRRARLAHAAHELVASGYSLTRMIERTIDLYLTLLRNPP